MAETEHGKAFKCNRLRKSRGTGVIKCEIFGDTANLNGVELRQQRKVVFLNW